jgi:hypothetical protein
MARAEGVWRLRAGLLAALVPAMLHAAEPQPAAAPSQPPEPGLLEFLAEEPQMDEELGEALLSRDLDRALERSRKDEKKVREDEQDPA